MLPKLFIKVSLLFVALVMVVGAMGFFGSNDFKRSVTDMFNFDAKTYAWCPDHVVDFQWLDPQIQQKWKNASWPTVQKRFCRLTLEPIQNIDISKITFKPLLKVQSAEAKSAQLEWDPESGVFQVNGLPFYSTSLRREILDK